MWTAHREQLANGLGLRVAVDVDASPIAYSEVLDRWRTDEDFRAWFLDLLADAPFSAFRWETPPITIATADRPFEFVLLNRPSLERSPDRKAFAKHFKSASAGGVVEFENLGQDAILVVPCPGGVVSAYGHLAAFVRGAPEAQRHLLLESIGAAMQRRLGAEPVWLSTAGAGVAWLHVRLDDRPKYYGYEAYRSVE